MFTVPSLVISSIIAARFNTKPMKIQDKKLVNTKNTFALMLSKASKIVMPKILTSCQGPSDKMLGKLPSKKITAKVMNVAKRRLTGVFSTNVVMITS